MSRTLAVVVGLFLILTHYPVAAAAQPVQRRICNSDVTVGKCSKFFNGGGGLAPWPSLFPNARNLDLLDSLTEFSHYDSLLVSKPGGYCSYMLHSFLCLHYFPSCDPTWSQSELQKLVVPCRRLCKAAVEECLSQVTPAPIPEHLNCENFPEECEENSADTVVVACPTPAVHLEFCVEFHYKKLSAFEGNGTIDICVKLSSTGTHDSLHSNVTVHLTAQDISAIGGGVDYDFSNCTTLVFTVGMVKGDTLCCSVKIIEDVFIEEKEEFSVFANVSFASDTNKMTDRSGSDSSSTNEIADILSGSGSGCREIEREPDLRFGGMFNSTSGSVEVCIIDNDVCSIHDSHCSADVCNQRTSANKNTLKTNTNTYTWAAHVELLQVTNSSTCIGLSVRMIKCCNLRRNEHCPENVEQLLISTCPGCPKSVVVNTQYLIAGNMDNHLIIPNTKKTGIFAIWEPKYETGIIDWNNC